MSSGIQINWYFTWIKFITLINEYLQYYFKEIDVNAWWTKMGQTLKNTFFYARIVLSPWFLAVVKAEP